MDTTKLTSGIEEVTALITTVMLTLRTWREGFPGVLIAYDAGMLARDPSYKPFGTNGKALQDAGFIDDGGRMHDSIANIVRCSMVGEGLDMKLVNPVTG